MQCLNVSCFDLIWYVNQYLGKIFYPRNPKSFTSCEMTFFPNLQNKAAFPNNRSYNLNPVRFAMLAGDDGAIAQHMESTRLEKAARK